MFKPNQRAATDRTIAVGVTLLAVIFIAALGGVLLHNNASLDLDATVVEGDDPSNIHRVTTLVVEVENKEGTPIVPRFSTVHNQLQTRFYWDVVRGKEIVQPGERATFRIHAPTPAAGLPYGGDALLTVNDNGTDRAVRKRVRIEKTDIEPVLNPDLAHPQRNPYKAHFEPFRWSATTSNHGAESTTIDATGGDVSLHTSHVTRTEGPWAMAGITQPIAFPQRLHVEATPKTVLDEPTKYPQKVTGVELGEGKHRVWLVFANVSDRRVLYRSGELSYIMVFVPATADEPVEATVNITRLYERYGWQLPQPRTRKVDGINYRTRTANLLAFSAVYPGNRGETAAVEFHTLSVDSVPGRNHTAVRSSYRPRVADAI